MNSIEFPSAAEIMSPLDLSVLREKLRSRFIFREERKAFCFYYPRTLLEMIVRGEVCRVGVPLNRFAAAQAGRVLWRQLPCGRTQKHAICRHHRAHIKTGRELTNFFNIQIIIFPSYSASKILFNFSFLFFLYTSP